MSDMLENQSPSLQVLGAINTAEAKLLADVPDMENDPQAIAIRERLGATALVGDAVAVVVEEDDEGHERALKYVRVGNKDLGTHVKEYEKHGLKDPAAALRELYKPAESMENDIYLSRPEKTRIREMHAEFTQIYDQKRADTGPHGQDRADYATVIQVDRLIADAESQGTMEGLRTLVGFMAAGAIKNPKMAFTPVDATVRAGILGSQDQHEMTKTITEVYRINQSDNISGEEKLLAIDNLVNNILRYLKPEQNALRMALLAYGAGATLDNPNLSASYMQHLEASYS